MNKETFVEPTGSPEVLPALRQLLSKRPWCSDYDALYPPSHHELVLSPRSRARLCTSTHTIHI